MNIFQPMERGFFLTKILRKIRNVVYRSCDILDFIIALIVLGAILIACISLTGPFMEYWDTRFAEESFLIFVGHVFNILIGIEFFKMLCRPNEDTVLEVLIFLVARHMIIEDTTVIENLITIISIGMLFAIKKYINLSSQKKNETIFTRKSNDNSFFSDSNSNSEDKPENFE